MFKLFKKKAVTEIYSPVDGKIITLEEVSDPVFSSKSMGDGFAVIPESNSVFSPIVGTVVSIFPTKHAIGLVDDEDNEVLIHIGIDTVSLNGEGFTILVKEGDAVNSATQLAEVDFAFLKSAQKETTTMVIFTNLTDQEIKLSSGNTKAKSVIGKIK